MHIIDELRVKLEAAQSVLSNCEYGRAAVARGDGYITSEELETLISKAKDDVADIKTEIDKQIRIATGQK